MNILLVLTGGTIVSEPSEYGLRTSSPELQFRLIQTALAGKIPDSVQFTPIQPFNLLSEVMHPTDWGVLASAIQDKIIGMDGVLILHGTDTLGYTAAIISYIEGISKSIPVVLTGASFPVGHVSSDAITNISQSVLVLRHMLEHNARGVYVVFNGTPDLDSEGKIFLGSRVKKRTWREHCYQNFNIGEREWVGVVSGQRSVTFYSSATVEVPQNVVWTGVNPHLEPSKIDFFKIAPGWSPERLKKSILDASVSNVLLEIYNSGTAPTQGAGSILEPLYLARDLGKLVFAISQHEGVGGMTLDCYETSVALRDAGLVSLRDMMWENAIPKLMLAAGNFTAQSEIKEYMLTNISGEIRSPRVS